MQQITYIPTIQLRNNCAVYYWTPDIRIKGIKQVILRPAYSGDVTKGMQKRIGNAVDVFLQTTETRTIFNTVTQRYMDFRLGFVTLTISDECDWTADKTYQCLLKPWLRVMKEKHNVKKYLWKYELQNRGNVHYHVTVDEFIPLDSVRGSWNKLQHKHRLTDKYAEKHGHFNPNSTDVHKVWKIKNIGAYLGKYLSKGIVKGVPCEGGVEGIVNVRAVKGKVWDCSTDLKRKRFSAICGWQNNELIEGLVQNGRAKVIHMDKCTIVECGNPEDLLTENQKIDYCIWKYK